MFSSYVKQRIVFFRAKGYKAPMIAKLLRREGIREAVALAFPSS